MDELIRKCFEMKAGDVQMDDDAGTIKGHASVMGVMDLGGDVIYPGFFRKALPAFRKQGFVPVGHDWSALPVAMPTKAIEQGPTLYTEAKFHTTQAAQDARTVAKERLANGLTMGLSVGFIPNYDKGVTFFNSGADLLSHAEGMGCDMSLFDAKGIAACKTTCRGLLPDGCKQLVEYSIVPAPMNTQAGVTDAKSQRTGETKSICGSRSLPLSERDRAWDAGAAQKRLRGEDDTPNAAYRKAHMICDGATDEFGSYRFPFADVVDGKLTAIFRGVTAAAGALQGARGGANLSDSDRSGAKGLCEAYYRKAASQYGDEEIEAPWLADNDHDADDAGGKGRRGDESLGEWIRDLARESADKREFERRLRDAVGLSKKQAVALASGYFEGSSDETDSTDGTDGTTEGGTVLQSDSVSATTAPSGDTPTADEQDEHKAQEARARRLRHMRLREFSVRTGIATR